MISVSVLPKKINVLKTIEFDTKLGTMIAMADEKALHLLEFKQRRGLEREIERMRNRLKVSIIPGYTQPLHSIEAELQHYFNGNLIKFETPLFYLGSPFQKCVWEALQKIPFGKTCSYAELAQAIGKPSACRAVAKANGSNQIAIVIPCHRVINTGGALGGYAGGIIRKQRLIDHEKKSIK